MEDLQLMERGDEPWEEGWLVGSPGERSLPPPHPDEANRMLWRSPWNSIAKALVVWIEPPLPWGDRDGRYFNEEGKERPR